MTARYCPLLLATVVGAEVTHLEDANCVTTNCAWWDTASKGCAILSLPSWLSNIATELHTIDKSIYDKE